MQQAFGRGVRGVAAVPPTRRQLRRELRPRERNNVRSHRALPRPQLDLRGGVRLLAAWGGVRSRHPLPCARWGLRRGLRRTPSEVLCRVG